MKPFMWLFSGLCLGGLLTGTGYEHHFVLSDQGLLVVGKSSPGLTDTFVDIREWQIEQWAKHPSLAKALIEDGRSDLLGHLNLHNLLPDIPGRRPETQTVETDTETAIQ